jgi:hypothetical protein
MKARPRVAGAPVLRLEPNVTSSPVEVNISHHERTRAGWLQGQSSAPSVAAANPGHDISGMVALATCFTEPLHTRCAAASYAVFAVIFELLV